MVTDKSKKNFPFLFFNDHNTALLQGRKESAGADSAVKWAAVTMTDLKLAL